MEIRCLILVTVLLVSLSCARKRETETPKALPRAPMNQLAVATSDFTIGQLSMIHLDSGVVNRGAVPIHRDAILRAPHGSRYLFVVNRLHQDNIQILTRDLKSVIQYSVGRGMNPQDIAVVDDKVAYISCFHAKSLLKVDLLKNVVLKEIDFSSFAESPNRFPEMARMARFGTDLLVQVQRLDEQKVYIPTDKSFVVVVDTRSDSVRKTITLARTNPVGDFKTDSEGAIYLAEAGFTGFHSRLDGGIEKFRPGSLESLGLVIEEKALGGDLVDFEIVRSDYGVAIISVMDADRKKMSTRLVTFDPSRKRLLKTVLDPGDYTLNELEYDPVRHLVYLADRQLNRPGVRVFEVETMRERIESKFDVGLPPFQMELME